MSALLRKKGYVYATRLPNGLTKVGRATHPDRALAAQTYFNDYVYVLGLWEVDNPNAAERAAHRALWWCHVDRELFETHPQLEEAITDALDVKWDCAVWLNDRHQFGPERQVKEVNS